MSKYSYKHHLIKKIATFGVFSGFGILLFKYREGFYILQDLSVFQFVSFSSLVIFGITLSGSKLSRILNSFNIYLKKSEWFALSSMTTVLNGIFFKSGSLATSAYLKKKIRLPIPLLCRIVYWRPTNYFIHSFSYWKYYNGILNIFWERSNIFYIHRIYAYCSFSIYPARWKNNFAKKRGSYLGTIRNRNRFIQYSTSKY